jgi:hypothetical protein
VGARNFRKEEKVNGRPAGEGEGEKLDDFEEDM